MSTDHAPVPRVANRYGAPKPQRPATRRRTWLIWAVIGLAVAATGVFSLSAGSPAVSSKDVGFSIESPTLARVDYEITKDPEDTAECALQILNESYAVVGWTIVTIAPADGSEGNRTTSHSTTVRTESEGVSGGVNACWITEGS